MKTIVKVLVAGALAYGAYEMFGKEKTVTSSLPANGKTRQQMIDELFELHQHDWANFAGNNTPKSVYDVITNDEDLKWIYLVDTGQIEIKPEYYVMLKKYGWA